MGITLKAGSAVELPIKGGTRELFIIRRIADGKIDFVSINGEHIFLRVQHAKDLITRKDAVPVPDRDYEW